MVVVSAGTADLAMAEEAAVTAEMRGNRVERVYDAGVAGLHRLLAQHPLLLEANAMVVVAGMEGALASVVGGLVAARDRGADQRRLRRVGGRLAALITMLASCAPGLGGGEHRQRLRGGLPGRPNQQARGQDPIGTPCAGSGGAYGHFGSRS